MFRGILFALVFSFSVSAHEAGKAPEAAPVTVRDLMNGVVKIVVEQAGVFDASRSGGHGSGFIIGTNKKTGRAIIFTNRHVIETSDLVARKVTVEFSTDERRAETIAGEVTFVSRIHDFAVVEVDPTQLKRAQPRTMILPDVKSPWFDFVENYRDLQNQPVISIGHPTDGTNISTSGTISGLMFDPSEGPYIQTQTPSNPGNSGGPLISEVTGEVVGMTSAGRPRADGQNFSIPIGVILQEYITYVGQLEKKVTPNLSAPRSIGVLAKPWHESHMKALKLHDLVEKALPGYWNEYDTALTVIQKGPHSKLEIDDILLTLNGQVVGGHMYGLYKLAQLSPLEAECVVLRKGKVVKLKTPILDMSFDYIRRSVDYVYLSGMFIQEMPAGARRITRTDLTSGLYVAAVLPSPEVQYAGHNYPPPRSVITAVKFGDNEYRVNTLFELKAALSAHRGEKFVLIRAHRANIAMGERGPFVIRSEMTNVALLDGPEDSFVVPMNELLTSFQFSLHRFKRQFDFSQDGARTWDWRQHIHRDRTPSYRGCEAVLANAATPPEAAAAAPAASPSALQLPGALVPPETR